MRALRALAIYIAVVFIGGALLAPWLYWLAQLFAHAFPQAASMPFHRFMDRSFLLFALAGVWPMLRSLGATSSRDIGLVPPYGQWNRLFGGMLLGFFSLAAVAGIALGLGGRSVVPDLAAHKVVGIIFSAIGTAAVVATLEEILFRGGIFGGLRRVLYWRFALLISSVVFGIVHFLQRVELIGPVAWNSGLVMLPQKLGGFADFHALVPGFFSLTLIGVLLGLAYQRTGNLCFSIGLHAGWIFCLRLYSQLTVQTPDAGTWFWGSGKMTDGWLAFFALAVTLAVFPFLPLDQRRPHYTIPSRSSSSSFSSS
ncbi:MAG TPA: CPBP family intramembrane glutamic endopeptidase [Verrucomicrobiae bacterium]